MGKFGVYCTYVERWGSGNIWLENYMVVENKYVYNKEIHKRISAFDITRN